MTVPSQPLVTISAVSRADSTVSGSYPITVQGTTAAQPTPVPITTVKLTVQ